MASYSEPSPAERLAVPTLRRLWQTPTFLIGVLAVLGVWLARPLWRTTEARGFEPDFGAFRQQLDEANTDLRQLVATGRRLRERPETLHVGEFHFLQGTALVRLASQAGADQAALWLEARSHLEEANRLGVSASDLPRLRYRLAKVWLKTGGEKAPIVDHLQQALGFGADDRIEALSLLTEAQLLPPADVSAALESNGKLLAQPTSDERILAPARLLRGELLIQLRQFDKAVEVLVLVNGGAAPAIHARARTLLARGYQETEAWAKAAELLEQILADHVHPAAELGRLAYELGMCYRRLPERAQQAEDAWRRALEHEKPHSQAAALRLAELALQEKGGQGVLAILAQALEGVARLEEYVNPLVPVAEVIQLLERAVNLAREAGTYGEALELAKLLAKVAPAARAAALRGEVHAAWAARDPERGRERFGAAGMSFEEASKAPTGTLDYLSRSAECYRQAGMPAEQLRMLEQLLRREELPRERQGEVWFRLGEARAALGQRQPARTAFAEAVQFGGKFEHAAHFHLAKLEEADGKVDIAIKQLTLNANLLGKMSEDLRDRDIYVKTLETLGDLLRQQSQTLSDALSKYSLALASLGNTPAAWLVRFKAGECYWQIARELKTTQGRDLKAQETWEARRRNNLEWAAREFERIEREIVEFEKAGGHLTPEQTALRRQLDFPIAGTRFERGEFEQALVRYDQLVRSRAGTLDGLIALEGVAWCHQNLGQDQDVQATLRQVKVALTNLPDAIFKGGSARERRRYWEVELPEQLEGKRP